jgi:hypothetical protein
VADGAVIDELAQVFGPDEPSIGPSSEASDDDSGSHGGRPDGARGGAPASASDAARDDEDHSGAPSDGGRADSGAAAGGTAGDQPPPAVLFDLGMRVGPARAPDPTPPTRTLGRAESTEPDPARLAPPADGRTIRIGDDELPDVAYLDDELERSGSDPGSGPVVIEDDDVGDAIVASEATGRGIDTRLRQRRILVRRAAGRRRLRGVFIAGGISVAVVLLLGVLASSLFSIRQITLVGNRYADPDALRAVIVELDGTPALLADTTKFEEQLEEIPWVDDARVRVSFPNSASIEIRDRTPVTAMPGADGRTRVLDTEGRVLDLIEGQPIALVWISGPLTLDAPAGHFAPPGPSWASALVPKLTPAIRPRVDSMQVTPDGSDLRLYLRPASADPAENSADPAGDTSGDAADASAGDAAPSFAGPLIEVRFGSAIGDSAQIEKLVRLERVLADVDTTRVSVIDVSTAEVTVL